jgi:hypothetical protein
MTAQSALPSVWGVAAGIADADMVGASAKVQPVNPMISSHLILDASSLCCVLPIISSVFAVLAEWCIHRTFRAFAHHSTMGQTENNSIRANISRLALSFRHCSV